MSKLSPNDFMNAVKNIIGDRTDDDALKFLEDCKDTITEDKNDYKALYEAEIDAKKKLDDEWRAKYKERFYSSDTNINNNDNKYNQDNTNKDPNFDTRSEELKKAESITIEDLFKPVEE